MRITAGEELPPNAMKASRQALPLPSSFHNAASSRRSVVHQKVYSGRPKTSGSEGTRKTAMAHHAGARRVVGLRAMATPTATIRHQLTSVLTSG